MKSINYVDSRLERELFCAVDEVGSATVIENLVARLYCG